MLLLSLFLNSTWRSQQEGTLVFDGQRSNSIIPPRQLGTAEKVAVIQIDHV
jgi:hypothetical protein